MRGQRGSGASGIGASLILILILILILLFLLPEVVEAGATGWEWSCGLGVVSPGGELTGIPSGLGVSAALEKTAWRGLDIGGGVRASRLSVAGVDIVYLILSPFIAMNLDVTDAFFLKLSGGWSVHHLDYLQVPIRQMGDGPFFSLEAGARNDSGKASLELAAHRFDLEDNRGIPSEGWTASVMVKFTLP